MCICLAAVIISGCSDKGKSQKDSNPSGVETNGVEYIADNSYDYQKSNDIDRKITFDEAVSFINEDTKMRIEALSGYRYEITEAKGYRKLQAPISSLMTVAITAFPVYDRTPGLAVWVTYE